jgi:vancomycin resistance protein YoaR
MNDTVKERTVANGYTTGFIIGPGGQFREDLGGGVSTATTAVWTAAFYANMERIEQRAHSFWISRYRPGLEATVSWGSLDMRWRNPLKTAVLIKAYITDSSVTVTLYGTKTFDEVQAISSPMRNTRPFATVYSTDPLCVGQDGVNGFDITVTRKVIKDQKVVASQDFVTNYAAGPHVICGKQPATQ